jgi:hypothetical protein
MALCARAVKRDFNRVSVARDMCGQGRNRSVRVFWGRSKQGRIRHPCAIRRRNSQPRGGSEFAQHRRRHVCGRPAPSAYASVNRRALRARATRSIPRLSPACEGGWRKGFAPVLASVGRIRPCAIRQRNSQPRVAGTRARPAIPRLRSVCDGGWRKSLIRPRASVRG